MNFLLLTATVCAKMDQKNIVDPKTFMAEETAFDKIEPMSTEDIFKISGPVNGVCSSEYNSHPLAIKNIDKTSILGKWKTVLVDAEMLQRNYIPQCMSAEFFQLDTSDETLVFRVGELHSLKDDVTGSEVFAYSGQTMTLLFDNTEVPFIANQYSYTPSNKFTQFIDLGIPETMVTMTCVQIRGIAAPQMLAQMQKQMQYAEMKGNMEMYENIQNEIDYLSVGTMVNMYEVHVRDLEEYTPEKVEELKMEVSKALGLVVKEEVVVVNSDGEEEVEEYMSDDRLMTVMQDPKVCLVTEDL